MASNERYYPLPAKLERLEAYLCLAASVDQETLHTDTREKEYVEVRHAIWYIAREYMGISYPTLGRLYGRDHTTVIAGVERMRQHPDLERIVNALKERHPDLLERVPGSHHGSGISAWRL